MESKGLVDFLTLPALRNRTAMYIGEKSISSLKRFLDGFRYAQDVYKIEDKVDEIDFGRFHDWVAVYYGRVYDGQIDSTAGWSNIILRECQGQENVAVDVFFELYDKFRREGIGTLSKYNTTY